MLSFILFSINQKTPNKSEIVDTDTKVDNIIKHTNNHTKQ